MKQPDRPGRCDQCKWAKQIRDVGTATIKWECWFDPPTTFILGALGPSPQHGFMVDSFKRPVDPAYVCHNYVFSPGWLDTAEVLVQQASILTQ